MPSKAARQKNANDVGTAYDRFRNMFEHHFPSRRASIISATGTISSKRGW